MGFFEDLLAGQKDFIESGKLPESLSDGGDGKSASAPPPKDGPPNFWETLKKGQKEAVRRYRSQPYAGQYNLGYGPSLNKTTDTGTLPEGADIADVKGMRQSLSDKAGNALVKLAGKIGTSFLETAGDVLYGIPKAVIEGRFDAIYDNEASRVVDEMNQGLDEALPLYKTREEGAFTGIIPGTAGSANFGAKRWWGIWRNGMAPCLFPGYALSPRNFSKTFWNLPRPPKRKDLLTPAPKPKSPLPKFERLPPPPVSRVPQ